MEAGALAWDSYLLDKATFAKNFQNEHPYKPKETYLCYEMGLPSGDSRVPLGQGKGILHNKPPWHAESSLLQRLRSWELDTKLHYRVTCFLSWSPCFDCAQEMTQFLVENQHVTLSIFACRLYTKGRYKEGLWLLRRAGAHIAIMTSNEFEHCWETFVDNRGEAFKPWNMLVPKSQDLSRQLEAVLQQDA